MQLAKVIGRTTATVKHETLAGWRMLIVQPLGAKGQADGHPVIAVDDQGGGAGDNVIITSDGKSVQEMMGSQATPVRWAVLGVED